jgi:hypothetical protein
VNAPRVMVSLCAAFLAMMPRFVGACSHDLCGPAPYLAFPADGSLEVPINAVVGVHWPAPMDCCEGGDCPWESLSLRTLSGDEVPVVHETSPQWGSYYAVVNAVRLAPQAPLSPGTTYRVVAPSWIFGEEQEVGQFATGDEEDVVAPAAPNVLAVEVGDPCNCLYATDLVCCDDGDTLVRACSSARAHPERTPRSC